MGGRSCFVLKASQSSSAIVFLAFLKASDLGEIIEAILPVHGGTYSADERARCPAPAA